MLFLPSTVGSSLVMFDWSGTTQSSEDVVPLQIPYDLPAVPYRHTPPYVTPNSDTTSEQYYQPLNTASPATDRPWVWPYDLRGERLSDKVAHRRPDDYGSKGGGDNEPIG